MFWWNRYVRKQVDKDIHRQNSKLFQSQAKSFQKMVHYSYGLHWKPHKTLNPNSFLGSVTSTVNRTFTTPGDSASSIFSQPQLADAFQCTKAHSLQILDMQQHLKAGSISSRPTLPVSTCDYKWTHVYFDSASFSLLGGQLMKIFTTIASF